MATAAQIRRYLFKRHNDHVIRVGASIVLGLDTFAVIDTSFGQNSTFIFRGFNARINSDPKNNTPESQGDRKDSLLEAFRTSKQSDGDGNIYIRNSIHPAHRHNVWPGSRFDQALQLAYALIKGKTPNAYLVQSIST